MELKDLVLSTLEELDEKLHLQQKNETAIVEYTQKPPHNEPSHPETETGVSEEERRFLLHSRERLCVLFEGLQQQTGNPEAKLEMTLKFLQYYLGLIEERLSSPEH